MRRKANLNQVVCTLEGMGTLLQNTPGNFAVVIHGDRDCVNVLVQGMNHSATERFFCTNLPESDAIAGRSLSRLEACLDSICADIHPEVVFLLGTCLTALIGDQVEPIAQKISQHHNLPIVSLPGAGMRFVSQAAVTDQFAQLMQMACLPASPDGSNVNLIGFDPGKEIISLLSRFGVEVNATIFTGTSMDKWKSLPEAKFNLLLDRFLFSGFADQAESRFGQINIEVPYPVGYQATYEFIKSVVSQTSSTPSFDDFVDQSIEGAKTAVEKAKARTTGARLGYNIGSKKNFDPQSLAREGLMDLPAFEELGFVTTILVQGDDRPQRLDAIRQTLSSFGCHSPIAVFSDTVFFGDLCRQHDCDLVYASDHLSSQIPAKTGFIEQGSLHPGFSSVKVNIDRILTALGKKATNSNER